MTTTHAQPRRARQRGSALILAVSVLVIILIMAFSFVSATKATRIGGRSAAQADHVDSAIQMTIAAIGRDLSRDRIAYLDGTDLQGNPSADYQYDYPGLFDTWLAATEPSDLNNDGLWDRWSQVSRLRGDSHFRNADSMDSLASGADLQDDVDFTAANASGYSATRVDADGDGYYDSKWVRLHIPATDGMVWIAGVRIIDNTALVNVNTAKIFNPADTTGTTPSDIDLFGLLESAEGSNNLWGYSSPLTPTIAFDPLALINAQWTGAAGYLDTLGLPGNTGSYADRRTAWDTHGRWVPSTLGVHTPNGAGPAAGTAAFGWSDEAELRIRHAYNSWGRSALEEALEGPHNPLPPQQLETKNHGALRSFALPDSTEGTDRFTNLPPGIGEQRIAADRRRLLTVHSGIGADANTGRRMMPGSITNLLGLLPGSTPAFDPNVATPGDLAITFSLLLAQNRYMVPPTNDYEYSFARPYAAYEAAHALAANLVAYRALPVPPPANGLPDNVYFPSVPLPAIAPTPWVAGETRVYSGLRPQPFIAEALSVRVHIDTTGDGWVDPEPTDEQRRLLVIELRNPWPVAINLAEYAIRVDYDYTIAAPGDVGAEADLSDPMTPVLLPPGGAVLIHSDDPDLEATLQRDLPVNSVVPGAPQFDAHISVDLRPGYDGANEYADFVDSQPGAPGVRGGIIEIVRKADGVRVDRFLVEAPGVLAGTFGNEAAWPAPSEVEPPLSGNPPTLISGRRIVAASAWRAWDGTSDDSSGVQRAMPAYVYENPDKDVDFIYTGAPHPDSRTGQAYFPDDVATSGVYPNPLEQTFGQSKSPSPPWPGLLPPPATQLPYRAATPIETLGEIANLFTVAHYVHRDVTNVEDPDRSRTFGELMYERLDERHTDALATTNGVHPPDLAKLRLYEFPRSQAPMIPVAMTIFDAFDLLGPITEQDMIPGVININTAPHAVLETLPYLVRRKASGTSDPADPVPPYDASPTFNAAQGLIAYRDMLTAVGDYDFNARADTLTYTRARFSPTTLAWGRSQAPAEGPPRVDDRGFASIAEVMAATGISPGFNYHIAAAALDGANTPAGTFDFTTDDVIDDWEEHTQQFAVMSNLITTRSDVFTAYVLLQGRRYNDADSRWDPVVTRRFVVTFDRSEVTPPPGNPAPKVLMYTEQR